MTDVRIPRDPTPTDDILEDTLPFPSPSGASNEGIGDLDRGPPASLAVATDMLDLADATDATVPLLVAFVCEPSRPIELPLAVLAAPVFEA